MKKMKRILGVLSLALALMTLVPTTASAGYGKRIAQKILDMVEYLEEQDETIACINADQLTSDENIRTYTRHLYSGNEYTAVAMGDSRIADTDLVVYRRSGGSWEEVTRDADASNTAVCTFRCNRSGDYKFEVKAYRFESDNSTGFYGFILSF